MHMIRAPAAAAAVTCFLSEICGPPIRAGRHGGVSGRRLSVAGAAFCCRRRPLSAGLSLWQLSVAAGFLLPERRRRGAAFYLDEGLQVESVARVDQLREDLLGKLLRRQRDPRSARERGPCNAAHVLRQPITPARLSRFARK